MKHNYTHFLILFFFTIISAYGQVGIGTTNPSNQLDVNGWLELGDQTIAGTNVEGAMRYNSTNKCMEFYNGLVWNCIGRTPKMQTFRLLDGIDESISGSATNNVGPFSEGGYDSSERFPFVVNNVLEGDKILFLVEVVVNAELRKYIAYQNSMKIYGNGIFVEKDMPGLKRADSISTFFWSDSVNTSGNLTFYFEVNMALADVRITSIIF